MKRIIFIMLILAAGVLIILQVRIRTLTHTKEVMSAEEFTLQMEAKGYTVRDNDDVVNLFNAGTWLTAELGGFRVDFSVHRTTGDARLQYGGWRYFVRGRMDHTPRFGRRTYRERRGENFDKITGIYNRDPSRRNDSFHIIVRVDNTILSIHTDIENRAAAEALLNTFGY